MRLNRLRIASLLMAIVATAFLGAATARADQPWVVYSGGDGLSCFDAARLGTRIHGLAGDLAAEEFGQVSLIASDLLRFLPAAFRGV